VPQEEDATPSDIELRHVHDLTQEDPFSPSSSRRRIESERGILESVALRGVSSRRQKDASQSYGGTQDLFTGISLRSAPKNARTTKSMSAQDEITLAKRKLGSVSRQGYTSTSMRNVRQLPLANVRQLSYMRKAERPSSMEGEPSLSNRQIRHVEPPEKESPQEEESKRVVQLRPLAVKADTAAEALSHLPQDDSSSPDDVEMDVGEEVLDRSLAIRDVEVLRRKSRKNSVKASSSESSPILCWPRSHWNTFWQVLVRTLVILCLLLAVLLPVYFLQFHDWNVHEEDIGSLGLFPTTYSNIFSHSPANKNLRS